MAPRLAFMDLSVDLKTLIVQHVSLWVDGLLVGEAGEWPGCGVDGDEDLLAHSTKTYLAHSNDAGVS